MITYEQALTFIHNRKIHGSRPGLHRIKALLEQLGNPQKGLPFLHIAGTNGKGSTATMLASVLKTAGYKTGCFTSPFVFDFRERFAINGEMIPQEDLARLTEQVKIACDSLKETETPTEFEIVAAIGFLWFQEQCCDIVVLETGLGGRFDATNVIEQPLASVICSISLDHTAFLGDTIRQIAFEKAGIIKKNCPIILYAANPREAIDEIRKQADLMNAPLIMGTPLNGNCNANGCTFTYKGAEYSISLCGAHQINNAVTVLETLFYLRETKKIAFTEEQLREGLLKAYIPARLDRICNDPPIFTDGGHNKDGIDSLVAAMDQLPQLQRPVIIFGMLKDKPYQYAVQKLALRAKAFLTVSPAHPRAMTAFDLKNMADLYCDDCVACDTYAEAARLAKEKCDGAILVAGSLYMLGDMTRELKKLFQ